MAIIIFFGGGELVNGIERIRELYNKLSFSMILRSKIAADTAVMIFEKAAAMQNFPHDVRLEGITSSKLQKYIGYCSFVEALPSDNEDRLNAWSKGPNYLRSLFGNRDLSADEKNCFSVLLAALEDRYEKYDGSGYPKGKRRDEICLLSHIADVAEWIADKKLNCVAEKDILGGLDEFISTYYNPKLIDVAKTVVTEMFDSDREWFGLYNEKEGSVQIEYQKIMDCLKDELTGCESRMILRTASGDGMIPAVYVPVAERNGRITELTLLHLEKSCIELARGRIGECTDVQRIWMSVSAVSLKRKSFVSGVKRILKKYSVYPDKFVFQITETAIGFDDPVLTESVAELHGMGIGIAVEHFGNEYSSLSILADFEADTVKLDGIFAESVAENKKTYEIVKSIIELSEKLGVTVVATGVKTQLQKDMLREAGCRYMQGEITGDWNSL